MSLQDEILSEFGKKAFRELEIPSYITSNLNKELREYQNEALKMFLANKQTLKKNHLMFNMATGSGKTLVMAALMLQAYKMGFRNFVFFVNSTAILEKTRVNFCDKFSFKYLFKDEIIINKKRVEIREIESFDESKSEAINIYFTTIQGLFSLFKNTKENRICLDDFKDLKCVFLADEAHHLNSETKENNKLNKEEKEIKEGWESMIKKAFESNEDENLLLEFSATIPNEKSVLEKYNDKIVFKYDLKEFCNAGYSKKIMLLKYENESLEYRFLGACLMSLFRELVLEKEYIKPVILFKSESINKSNENKLKFIEFTENLQGDFIKEFYKNTLKNESLFSENDDLLSKSYAFFKAKFGDFLELRLTEFIKANFKKEFILNVNDEKENEKHQLLLNNLESKENQIRVIFSVNKLNEGWDVLNLFDIVRLKNETQSKKATTQEAQLIGRGARYYPFLKDEFDKEFEFKRKFDKEPNDLEILEYLTYHARNETSFINDLNDSLITSGLLPQELPQKVELQVREKIKNSLKNEKILYAVNKRVRKKGLFKEKDINEIKQSLLELFVPLFANNIDEKIVDFKKENEKIEFYKPKFLNEIEPKFYLKAMNVLGLSFNEIKKSFKYESKLDFIENFLGNLKINFKKNQQFNTEFKLKIAKFIIENFQNNFRKMKEQYEVSSFETKKLNIENKTIFTHKLVRKINEFEWLFFDELLFKDDSKKRLDSALELDFLKFIESRKEELNKAFYKWFVIRNEGFSEFKIYNFCENENFARGFEPDFILFVKRSENDEYFSLECFVEAKGEHLTLQDKWKEDLLELLKDKNLQNLKIFGLPFFKDKNANFKARFDEFLEKKG